MGRRLVLLLFINRAARSPNRMEEKTMTITEAAKMLGIGRNNAYAAARNGDIPTIKIGKCILVPTAPLKKMLGEAA